MRNSIEPDVRIGTETKESGTHTLAQDAPPAFLSSKAPSISNLGDELPLQFMFYEPRFQETEPVVPKTWQNFGYRHVSGHEFSRHLSPIQSRSLEYSSSQMRSSCTELPSTPTDVSSYLEELSLMASRARPSSRSETLSDTEVRPIPEHEPNPAPLLSQENAPSSEHPLNLKQDGPPQKPGSTSEPSHQTEDRNTHIGDNKSGNDLNGKSSNRNPVYPNSTTKSNNPQPSKDGPTTSDDPFEPNILYHLLFSAVNSDTNDNTPPETPNPTTPDKLPPPPPPAESPSLDAFLSQPVPTEYLPVNAQLPTKMTWLDVLSLAQSVLACEEEPATKQVHVRTVGEVDENPAADADVDADGHSLLAKSHVAEVEECAEDDAEEEDEDTGSVIRSSFSSFDIRDVNLSLHKEVSRIWSWREKWRGTRGSIGRTGILR